MVGKPIVTRGSVALLLDLGRIGEEYLPHNWAPLGQSVVTAFSLIKKKTTELSSPNIFTIFASNRSKSISFDSLTFNMPAYTEEEMQNAIAAVENGCSLHQASKQYKIP